MPKVQLQSIAFELAAQKTEDRGSDTLQQLACTLQHVRDSPHIWNPRLPHMKGGAAALKLGLNG